MKNSRFLESFGALLRRTAIGLPLTSAALFAGVTAAQAAEELNALVWCDHTDPALIQPFEEKFGVTLNLKEYEGTGAALAIVEQSQPGDWDVFVLDGVDVPRVAASGLLAELPADQMPLDDVFSQVQMRDMTFVDGKMYAIGGSVPINTSEGSTPDETLERAERVRAAAGAGQALGRGPGHRPARVEHGRPGPGGEGRRGPGRANRPLRGPPRRGPSREHGADRSVDGV